MVVLKRGDDVVVAAVTEARGFWTRGLGLMGRAPLGTGRALWLVPCRSIHTGFMRFNLDVLFLDGGMQVVRRVNGIPPWQTVWGGRRAVSVVEMQAGWLPDDAARVGDVLTVCPR